MLEQTVPVKSPHTIVGVPLHVWTVGQLHPDCPLHIVEERRAEQSWAVPPHDWAEAFQLHPSWKEHEAESWKPEQGHALPEHPAGVQPGTVVHCVALSELHFVGVPPQVPAPPAIAHTQPG
jgi:hypothetical protein